MTHASYLTNQKQNLFLKKKGNEYKEYKFDRIIFNFPQIEPSIGDYRLKSMNQNLVYQFLLNNHNLLKNNINYNNVCSLSQMWISLHVNEFTEMEYRKMKLGPLPPSKYGYKKDNDGKIRHNQFETWDIQSIIHKLKQNKMTNLKNKQSYYLTLNKTIPFETQTYFGYRATNVKGHVFQFCKANLYVFAKFFM